MGVDIKKLAENFKKLPDNYTFGLELEFTGGMSCEQTQKIIDSLIAGGKIREGWTVHYDNSVVDENKLGAEIVSPVLKDDQQTRKELEIITLIIKKSGGVMKEKDGGHIHFGVQCLGNNIEEIKNFFKIYTIFEPLLYKLSTGDLDYVRPGCKDYAKPIQNRLVNVIDGKVDSLSELMALLSANVGANPTHYGENRYYGLNIQRMIEAMREKDPNVGLEEFLQKMFTGEPIFDKNGKKLSPTIEMRFRNGSSNADEILAGVRMAGGMFELAKRKDQNKESILKSLYRSAKKRATYVFDKVLNANRTDSRYIDCTSDEEILRKKFLNSIYGDGKIDYSTIKTFFKLLNPDIDENKLEEMINYFQNKVKPTEYKTKQLIEQNNTNDILQNIINRFMTSQPEEEHSLRLRAA